MLNVPLKYVNHDGETISLNADGIYIDPQDILEYEADVKESGNALAGFSNSVQSYKLNGVIYGTEGTLAKRDALYEVTSVDRENVEPGQLYFGDWYRKCYVTAATISGWRNVGTVGFTLTVTDTGSPYWIRETTLAVAGEELDNYEYLDYPHDFDFDYGYGNPIRTVENVSSLSADVLIRIYGAYSNPYLTINDNVYGITGSLEANERLEINTAEKTVTITRYDGSVDNAFSLIYGDYYEDSGSYIFQKVPKGTSEIIADQSMTFDIVLMERRELPMFQDLA